jgi:hypothetical protein
VILTCWLSHKWGCHGRCWLSRIPVHAEPEIIEVNPAPVPERPTVMEKKLAPMRTLYPDRCTRTDARRRSRRLRAGVPDGEMQTGKHDR